MDFIIDLEHSVLNEGDYTCLLSSLSKLHKFLSLSSGSNSCTDSFLKAAAHKPPSYLQDPTSFINKIKSLKFMGNILIAVSDVESLYPYIDCNKGVKAFEHYSNQRNNQGIAMKVLKYLILPILRMNTMMFCGRYFHQIAKGTTMGTCMAVNYVNCFIGCFKTNL